MIEIHSADELSVYLDKHNPVCLVVYGATCVPCQQLKEHLQENVVDRYPNVTFLLLNGTNNRTWAVEQGIRTVPTTIIFDTEDDVRNVITGFNKEKLEESLRKYA